MATVEELLILIDATTEGLRKEMKRGADETEKFRKRTDRNVSRVERRFQKMGASIKRSLAGFAAALSVTALVRFTRSAIAAGDRIGKAAATAGIAADQLQELRFAFGQLAGTTDKEVDESIRRFNRRIGLAQQGMGEAIKVSERLGLSFRDAGGNFRSTGDLLEEVIPKLAAIENDAIRAAQASQLFGEDAGPRLAAALGKGIDAMEALREATPGVLSPEQVRDAEALTDAFDRMARTVGGALKGAFIDAAGAMARFFAVPEAFNTFELIDQQLERLEARAAKIREGQGLFGSISGADQANLDQIQRDIEALQLQRSLLDQEANQAEAQEPSSRLVRIRPTAKRLPAPEVGPTLAEGLSEINPQTATAFNLQLLQMERQVDDIRESVLSLEETTDERVARMANTWGELGNAVSFTLRSSLTDAFLGIERDWRQTIKRMIADWLVQRALLGIGASIGGPVGSFLGGLFGRQDGGHVAPGRAFLVGERGPEVFVPNVDGTVMSNASLGGASVSINTSIDARGADPTLLTRLGPALDMRDQRLKADIATMIRRRKI